MGQFRNCKITQLKESKFTCATILKMLQLICLKMSMCQLYNDDCIIGKWAFVSRTVFLIQGVLVQKEPMGVHVPPCHFQNTSFQNWKKLNVEIFRNSLKF